MQNELKKSSRYLSKIWPLSFLTISCFIIAYLLMGHMLFDLNTFQLDRSGDGFKNYFVFAYQYKFGQGYWFDGMQYPYGDVYSYTDGQPLLLFVFRILKAVGVDIGGYELLLLQTIPIFAMLLGSLFIFKIVKHYTKTVNWSLIVAAFCVMLSPQLFRFSTHFSLSYIFCFPSIWYLIICFEEKKIRKFSFVLIASSLLFLYAFLHPYHLLIGSVFIFALFTVKCLFKKIQWPLLFGALIPLILYLVFNSQVDIYHDRTQNPWGMWHYKTEVSDMLPFYGWFSSFFKDIFSVRSQYMEGYCYIGILFFVSPYLIYLKIKNDGISIKTDLGFVVLASILTLMFAMGTHLLLTNQQLNEWLPPLKQFRGLGRFSWPYYYVCFIGLAVYVYKLSSNKLQPIHRNILLCTVILLWAIDGWKYTERFKEEIFEYHAINQLYTNQELKTVFESNGYSSDDFQAVLPLPTPIEGAEKLHIKESWVTKVETIPFVFQTGLPMIGCYMSRSSLSRILKQTQLTSSPYLEKTIINDFKSDKDLVLIVSPDNANEFKDITDRGYIIGESKYNVLYGISVDSVKSVKRFSYLEPTSGPSLSWYNGFLNGDGLHSNGVMEVKDEFLISEMNVEKWRGDSLKFSVWYKIEKDETFSPKFLIDQFDDNQKLLSSIEYEDKDMLRFEVIDDWVRIIFSEEINFLTQKVHWRIKVKSLKIDHALITSAGAYFQKELDNNFRLIDHQIISAN